MGSVQGASSTADRSVLQGVFELSLSSCTIGSVITLLPAMFLAQNYWGELDDWLANCLDVLPQQFIAFATQEWSPDQWSPRVLISILILAGSAFVQATVGFAAALFGLPLLLWAGNSLVEAQVMIITAMLAQNFLSVWKLRRSIDLREVVVPAAIRISALPIGVAGLGFVMTWSAAAVNQLVGGIILFAVALQSLVGIEWKNANKPIWVAATFGGSGILQGLSGMSGPPMVLWVHGQRFSADRARAFLFSMYISNFGPQMALLTWRFGFSVWYSAGIALLSVPLVIVGALLGLRLGSWFGDRWLRPITYLCLIVLAVSSMLEPWLNRP